MLILNYMVSNGPANNFTLKSQVEYLLNYVISGSLTQIICREDSPTDRHYKYEIKGDQSQTLFSVDVLRNDVSIRIDKTGQKPGIYSSFLSKMDPNDSCGIEPPKTPLDQKIFGGGQ